MMQVSQRSRVHGASSGGRSGAASAINHSNFSPEGRARPGRASARWAIFLGVAAFFSGKPAAAQSVSSSEFSVQRFDPAPGPRNFFTTRGVRTDGKMAWSAGLVANFASDPLVIVSCRTKEDCSDPSSTPGRKDTVHVIDKI